MPRSRISVMAGALSPQAGHVEIDGLRRRRSEEEELEIRRRVVFVPDHAWLPKNRTGRDYLHAVARLYEIDDARLMEHANSLAELFEMREEADRPIDSYSNGQKHKIAICAALIAEPEALLLDEPFSGGLDPSGILALKRVLQHLAANGTTIVLSAPVPELLEDLADRIAILRDGRVAAVDTLDGLRKETGCDGPLSEVLQHLVHPETLDNLNRYLQGRKP